MISAQNKILADLTIFRDPQNHDFEEYRHFSPNRDFGTFNHFPTLPVSRFGPKSQFQEKSLSFARIVIFDHFPLPKSRLWSSSRIRLKW